MKKLPLLVFVFITSMAFSQQLQQLGSAMNTEYNEIHPFISSDGKTLFFLRANHPSNTFGDKNSQDVWYSELREDDTWSIARRMPNTVNKDQYNDVFSMTPDGNSLLIRGVYVNGRREDEIGISMCKRTKTGWSEPQKVDIPKLDDMIKSGKETAVLSVFLSNDGKTMILSFSERKNGNEDLYVSFLDKSGKWSKPENLGDNINTGDIETTPFMASDNFTLYFATDRKGGLGGTDIWVSKRLDKTWKRWSKPINMGDKVNSDANEYYYSIPASGEFAYMSTRKNSIGKGDIVRLKLKDIAKGTPTTAALQSSGDNRDAEQKNLKDGNNPVNPNSTAPTPVVMIKGKVLDQKTGKPIEAKVVYETLPNGEEVGEAYTNPTTGEYTIMLPYGSLYSYRAVAKDFISVGKNIDLTTIGEYKEIKNEELKLVPIVQGSTVALNNIFFEFGRAALREDSFPELNRLIDVLNENQGLVIEIQGHTDNVGSDESNLKLSQDRAEAVRTYLLSKKVAVTRVQSVGYGESRPIASNDTVEGQAKNRRVEFVIVRK